MNENVKYGLENYLRDVDPQYAVLLTGEWGCGKTYFVKKWLEDLEQRKEDYSVTPIYISLFGISSIPALIEKVNKTLSPLMYNLEKCSKKLLQIAGKIVLKYDGAIADMNEAKLAYEINPIDLLSIKDADNSVLSTQYVLFVFDDIERCKIVPEELMGFFDLCLEQLGCRLVVLKGRDDAQTDEWLKIMSAYQEKIFSREFEILPDVQSAILHFVNELSVTHPKSSAYFNEHVDEIKSIFECSKCCNLRSLRHGIRAFAEILEKLELGADDFVYRLFVQYLAFSLEFYNGDRLCLNAINIASFIYPSRKKDSPEQKLFDKYIPIQQKFRIKAFDSETYDDIKSSLFEGREIVSELNDRIGRIREKSLSERLRSIWNMENKEADALIKETKEYLARPILDISGYVFATYMLCYLEDLKVVPLRKNFEQDRYKAIKNWLKTEMQPSNVSSIQHALFRACGIQEREKRLSRFSWLYEQLQVEVNSLLEEVREPIIELLERASNENMEQIAQMMNDVDPYGHANYNMQAVFQKVNILKLCVAIGKLNNYSRNLFAEILASRYNHDWDEEYYKRFLEEKESLDLMLRHIHRCRLQSTRMRRVSYAKIEDELLVALTKLESIS